MRLAAVAFFAGVVLFHNLAQLPEWRGWLLLPATIALACYCRHFVILTIAWSCLGFYWVWWWSVGLAPLQLPSHLAGQDLQVSGWVTDIPQQRYRSARFELAVERLSQDDVEIPFNGKIRLSWYSQPPPALQVGDYWQFTVRLQRPRGFSNPGGFDFERWLFVNGIHATGYVRQTPPAILLASAQRYPVDRFRQSLAERWQLALADSPHLGILTALAIGERQHISNDQWQVFSRTGTSHLMAISGLHIGLIAAWVFFLLRFICSRIPPLANRWPAPMAAAAGALAAALGYALLAGLSLPTQRALLMLSVALLALLAKRPVVPSRILALALFAVLLFDPYAPLSGGFWLSFAAVSVILYVISGHHERQPSELGQWLRLQVFILLALLPITLTLFQIITPLAPIANLIAIPWASVSVVPLTLLAVITGWLDSQLQNSLLQLAALTMAWLWGFLNWLAGLSWAQISWPAPPLWSVVVALPGVLLLLAPKGVPGRWLGMMLLLPLLFAKSQALDEVSSRFTILDAGDGLAAVLQTVDRVMVYDTGPRLGVYYDAGRAALIPFLRSQAVNHIDLLVISHHDSRHSGGIRSLREQFSIGEIITAEPEQIPIEDAAACRRGDEWQWQSASIRVLHPADADTFSGDNASCLVQINDAGHTVLLTGDIDQEVQALLAQRYRDELLSAVLVAPQQGQKSVAPSFIAATRPRYMLLATGYRKRNATSATSYVDRWQDDNDMMILDTAENGAISFLLTADKPLAPELYRPLTRRYWHTP